MGMTGQIRVPGVTVNWGAKKVWDDVATELMNVDDDGVTASTPPRYTQLIFRCYNNKTASTTFTAYFCDPRKFGSCSLVSDTTSMDALAPDALLCEDANTIASRILPRLARQRLGIKAILLDQKRAVSGVGNWCVHDQLG